MPQHYRARQLIHHWVEHRGSSIGLGLCIDVGATTAEVDYFPVPGAAPNRKTIPVDELKVVGIDFVGRRAWLKNRPYYGYRSGIIERHDRANKMYIRLLDGTLEALPAERIILRQETPFTDALRAVQAGAVENAAPYLARRDLVSQLVIQRDACHGYDAVPSSAIGFYDHQLETLQRVLEDPICRFILADEVGLGKTIEAGLIVRQTLLDDPSAEIYIIAPGTLVQQWRNELEQKFLLGGVLDGPRNRRTRIWVLEHLDLFHQQDGLNRARLIVIDEAHQLVQHSMHHTNWAILSKICQNASGLLLLSATPMRGNYDILQALLHLVDAVAFPLDDQDAFTERIEERTAELREFDALTSPFSSPTARTTALENIRRRHPDDPYVRESARKISANTADASVADLGHYLRETYRISRRMVRHRRDVGAATDFPTSGRRLTFFDVPPNAGDELLDEFLDDYRDLIQGAGNCDELMWQATRCAIAGAVPLNEFFDHRISMLRHTGGGDSEERSLLSRFRTRLLLEENTRLRAAVEEACRRVQIGQRVVAISGFQSQAIEFARMAEEDLGAYFTVLRHLTDTAQTTRDDIADEFLFFNSGILLVGDASLEEGTNLQGSDALLNIDLGLSPNQIEQRVGRVDRYSGAGSIRQNIHTPDIIVMRPLGSTWCSSQVATLADGVGVFSSSVSTAQRFLAKWESELRTQLVVSGSKALGQGLENLQDSIQVEMAEVDELEAWESDSQDDLPIRLTSEDLDIYESRSAELESALLKVNDPKAGLPFRLLPTPGPAFNFSLRPGVRIPPSLDPAVEKLLLRPHTVSVEQALELGHGTPFRIGDPLVDWLQQYLQTDERGRAFVVVVPDEDATEWEFWLRCDFLLEFDDRPLAGTPIEDRRRLRRRGENFLPPRLVCVWANGWQVARETTSAALDGLLESSAAGPSADWSQLQARFPGWKSECDDAAKVANEYVRGSDSYREWISNAVSQANLDNARRLNVLRARSERLPTMAERKSALKDSELEHQLGGLILEGVRDPRLLLVNCGALVRRPKWRR